MCRRIISETAAGTIAVTMAALGRLTTSMRGAVTVAKPRRQASGANPEGTEIGGPRQDATVARHSLRRGRPGATAACGDATGRPARASTPNGGVETAKHRSGRRRPGAADLDVITEAAN